MSSDELVLIDPDVMGGTPVFRGTRVPISTLFNYLANGYTIAEILECFPTLTRRMIDSALQQSESALLKSMTA